MIRSDSFEAIARHVRENLREEPQFQIKTLVLEETFGLDGPWFLEFQRWLADQGHPFHARMGWQRTDGHQSGHVTFSLSSFE